MSRAERQAEVIAEILDRALRGIEASRPADRTLADYLRAHRGFGARDRRLYAESVFSFFRWAGWLESEPVGRAAGMAYALDHETLPGAIHALWPEAENAGPGVPDMLLEEKSRCAAAWMGLARPPAPERLQPDWVREAMPPEQTDEDWRRWLESAQVRPPLWLYAPAPHRAAIVEALHERGLDAVPHERLPEAVRVDGAVSRAAFKQPPLCYAWIQDLASQAAAAVCGAAPGASWLDACAGAGGKTVRLAEQVTERGRVLATDRRPGMLRSLSSRLPEACRDTVQVCDADIIKQDIGKAFDGILVDAPCSGMGTWPRNPDARWRSTRTRVDRAADIQRRMLDRLAAHVRPGGVLVYSVCTVSERETHGVIDAFLASHDDFRTAPFVHPLTGEPAPDGRTTIWPWEGPCNGMFIARMAKAEG